MNRLDSHFHSLYEALIISLEKGLGGPFAAGVVFADELISLGTNTVLSTFDVSRHAEINAVAIAGTERKSYQLADTILLTSHFPCLMCYHAIKWAQIPTFYYIFDYDETESLFGFHGDSAFMEDLQLSPQQLSEDSSMHVVKYRSDTIEKDYYGELLRRWNEEFKETCSDYDIV
jgi:tRNA(Arg) A34 adenosine deaminase TadA